MKKVIILTLGIFLILITGCLNSGNGGGENQNAVTTTEIQGSHNRIPGNRLFNRTGNWSRNMTDIPNMRNRFNITNMSSDQLTALKARLNLSSNASEEELMAALQKMREEQGMQPPGNPQENPPNNQQ